MNTQDFTLTLTVDQSPEQVFAAVTNVRGWWSEKLAGESAKAGDEFTYRYEDIHRSTHRVLEAVPSERVVWRTLDAHLSFTKDPAEWTNTLVRFDIARNGDKTELRFTHEGLRPEVECFEACARGWTYFIGESLRQLITTRKGKPSPKLQGSAA